MASGGTGQYRQPHTSPKAAAMRVQWCYAYTEAVTFLGVITAAGAGIGLIWHSLRRCPCGCRP